MKTKNNFITIFSGRWVLLISFMLLVPILGILYAKFYKFSSLWPYLVVSFGSIITTVIFWIARPYPFSADGTCSGQFNNLTEEDRKVLTFLKESKDINRLMLKTGLYLWLLIFIFPISKLIFPREISSGLVVIANIGTAFALMICYLVYCFLVFQFIIARYILTHFNEIKKRSDIKPWPVNKAYISGLLFSDSLRKKEAPSIITEFLNLDPNTPFNWYDFGILTLALAGFVLLWLGLETILKFFSVVGVLKIISGLILFQIAFKLWRIKHKK